MNTYITGITIKQLREKKKMTQAQLADKIDVSSKTISKWETGKGLPDISLIKPLSEALSVSIIELMSGDMIINKNVSANMQRIKLYVCPICGNVVQTIGEAVISCCGVGLSVLEAEAVDEPHALQIARVEDESYISIEHEMTKEHYISFIAYATPDRFQMVKLYPEGVAACRFKLRGKGDLYFYCNRHGLMKQKA